MTNYRPHLVGFALCIVVGFLLRPFLVPLPLWGQIIAASLIVSIILTVVAHVAGPRKPEPKQWTEDQL